MGKDNFMEIYTAFNDSMEKVLSKFPLTVENQLAIASIMLARAEIIYVDKLGQKSPVKKGPTSKSVMFICFGLGFCLASTLSSMLN